MDDDDDDGTINIPLYQPVDDSLAMIHLALQLRRDILSDSKNTGFKVNEEECIKCVPDSLYSFLRLLYGGTDLLDDMYTEEDVDAEKDLQMKILSIAQDIVVLVSRGKITAPKHIGLASTLHQATRSKCLVKLFNKAGHFLSYEQMLQVDTALAEVTKSTMNEDNGAVVPQNLVPGRFIFYTCDNIDINDADLNGKNTFHATQVAAWQRGPTQDLNLQNLKPSRKVLEVPDVMESTLDANVDKVADDPPFKDIKMEWFRETVNGAEIKAKATDMAFIMKRQNVEQNQGGRPTWTGFNKDLTEVDPAQTSCGFMPVIVAPAHEFDTLYTVTERIKTCNQNLLGTDTRVLTTDNWHCTIS